MKLFKNSQWFIFDTPIGEPDLKYPHKEGYHIQRLTKEDGTVIWFGQSTNWVKELNSEWTVLTINEDAKPLERYLPEIVYGEDRTYFKPCEMPIYEEKYIEFINNQNK